MQPTEDQLTQDDPEASGVDTSKFSASLAAGACHSSRCWCWLLTNCDDQITALISCVFEEQLCESVVQLLQLAIVRVLAVTPCAGNVKFITDAVDITLAFPTWSPVLRWRGWSSSALLSVLSSWAFSYWNLLSRFHCACGTTKCARSGSCRWPARGLKIYRSLLVIGVYLSVTVSNDSVVVRRASMVCVTVKFISIVAMSVYIIADFTALTNLKIARLPLDTNQQADRTMQVESASKRSRTTSVGASLPRQL